MTPSEPSSGVHPFVPPVRAPFPASFAAASHLSEKVSRKNPVARVSFWFFRRTNRCFGITAGVIGRKTRCPPAGPRSTVIPFIVHGTGGFAGTIDALRTLAPGAKVVDPIGFVREDVRGDPASESTARAHAASYTK